MLDVCVLVRLIKAQPPDGDMFMIVTNTHSNRQLAVIYQYDREATHTQIALTHRLVEVFMGPVKSCLEHIFTQSSKFTTVTLQ